MPHLMTFWVSAILVFFFNFRPQVKITLRKCGQDEGGISFILLECTDDSLFFYG